MVTAEIDPPVDGARSSMRRPTTDAVDEAAREIIERLNAADRPVLIVGVEVHRFQLREQVVALAERLNVPVASSFLGRGVFPTLHPQFVGTYLGVVSPPSLRETVERSDCVLLLGELVSDTSLGVSADCLSRTNLLIAVARDVYIRPPSLPERAARQAGAARCWTSPDLPRKRTRRRVLGDHVSPEALERGQDGEPIKVRHVIYELNEFLADHLDVPLVSDTGDCLFAAVDVPLERDRRAGLLRDDGVCRSGGAWRADRDGPASARARRGRRVPDDRARDRRTRPSTAATPSSCCSTTRDGKCCRRSFPTPRYNTTVSWPFARLAELWGGRGFVARTPREFR